MTSSAATPLPPIQSALCWICRTRPANSGEHRFKASDVRAVAPRASQAAPVFLQRDSKATNDPIANAKNNKLKFAKSICTECNNALTQPYDIAWQKLSAYLLANWPAIVKRGSFDLSKPFPGATRAAALDVHLFFVKLLGCKLHADAVPIDLAPFSAALLTRTPHPEVSITIADSAVGDGRVLMYDSEVHTMSSQDGELHGALWLYLIHPVAVKVGYIKAGARLHVVGYPWHPSRSRKIVRLSPFEGATEPNAGPGALLP
jgi:hypothetical protein